MSGLPPRKKRKGAALSYPDGLVSVIERTIRAAPIGTKRLNHRAAHSYLTSIGITASEEHQRMVKLCIKSMRTKIQQQVRKPRIEWPPPSQIQNVNGVTSSNRAEKAASATVLLRRLEAVDAMITAVMATRKAVEKQVETTLDNTKKANQYLCDVETGDTVWIQLDWYDNLSEATVVDEENENIHVEFVVDKTDDWYPRIHLDIVIVIKAAQQGHDEKRRTETTRASDELDRRNASLSHKQGKRNGRLLCKPQPGRDIFPNPAERPNLYDHVIIECGSGTANLGFKIYQMGKSKVGVYTIDWNEHRNAHLVRDMRDLDFKSLLNMFPKLVHVHFTWDCKANSSAGIR